MSDLNLPVSCFSTNTEYLNQQFLDGLLKAAIWREIVRIAQLYNGFELLATGAAAVATRTAISSPPRKRRNLSDQAGFCSPASGDDDDGEEAAGAVLLPRTAREAVEREKEDYFALDKTTADEENLAAFWNGMEKQMPALSRVAGGFLGALPGSGGLECDIGGVADLVGPKRASLKPGLVEAQLMIRVNKELVSLDTTEIVDLGKNWKDHIPSRPDYPVDYFDEETLSGQDSDDSDDDNDER
jgi:hypothetical protein